MKSVKHKVRPPSSPTMSYSSTLLVTLALTLTLTIIPAAVAVAEDDVTCLREFKSTISDPSSKLSSWSFTPPSTVGFICDFNGVSCWNQRENRVVTLSLPSSSLSGRISSSLSLCSSINNLDLSHNSFSGPLPSSLCTWLPYLVNLDLSYNSFSGPIPSSFSDCKFLNSLVLSNNQLSGPIPPALGALSRLKNLDLSSNQLTGLIPSDLSSRFDSSSFSNNDNLCGSSGCRRSSSKSVIIIVVAGVFGALVSLSLAYLIYRCCFSKKKVVKTSEEGTWWSDRLRTSHNRLLPVSLFQKPIVKVKVADLMAATNNFQPESMIVAGSSRVGTSYKAVLPDGSGLMIKRLHECRIPEKQFKVEVGKIGQVRHPNLVPLLGYCVVEEERLLIYKDMANGALSKLLHVKDENLDWKTRLKIGIGAARGLAWLHHGFQVPNLHRNISSSAILLDEDYEARIMDFGVARLLRPVVEDDGSSNTSPFLNGDVGEFGYVAPEYASHPVPSVKGDVYGFGVVLLELATGQKAAEVGGDGGFKGGLVDWVKQCDVGQMKEMIDRDLRGRGYDDEIVEFMKVACGCVVGRPNERFSMYKVYRLLKKIGGEAENEEQFDEFQLLYGKDEDE